MGAEVHCCGKRSYRTKPKAEKALEKWKAIRGSAGPVRTYRCENGYFHLTHLSKTEYLKIANTPKEEIHRRHLMMRNVINRDKQCVICGRSGGVLSVHPRVKIFSYNEGKASSYITSHHDCLHHGELSSDEKFAKGYQLDAHMAGYAHLYPICNDGTWYYLNEDGSTEPAPTKKKRML